jgi:hypothetical protein
MADKRKGKIMLDPNSLATIPQRYLGSEGIAPPLNLKG